eukprot:5146633-Pleurochrysis_carterae.AAC.2
MMWSGGGFQIAQPFSFSSSRNSKKEYPERRKTQRGAGGPKDNECGCLGKGKQSHAGNTPNRSKGKNLIWLIASPQRTKYTDPRQASTSSGRGGGNIVSVDGDLPSNCQKQRGGNGLRVESRERVPKTAATGSGEKM